MTSPHVFVTVSLMALLASAHQLHAQACAGLPQRSSIAFEHGKQKVGSSNGVSGSVAGGPVALSLGGSSRDIVPTLSGWDAHLGFDVVISASVIKICPGIGFLYQHDTWDVDASTSLKSDALDLSGGLAIGMEQRVYKDFSVIPFVSVKYRFNVTKFDLQVPSGESAVTGDTLSGVNIGYGVSVHYRFLFAGVALNRTDKTKGSRPESARYLLGVTMGGFKKKK